MRSSSTPGFDIREAVEGLRDAISSRTGGRSGGTGHGDIRTAVLTALHGGAKNGHQVMQAIAAASGGAWKPAASQVYPTLQQLTDEGLVTAHQEGERTVYALTDAGRSAAEEAQAAAAHDDADRGEGRDPWRMPRMGEQWSGKGGEWAGQWSQRMNDRMGEHWNQRWEHSAAVPKAGARLAQAAAQVAQSGTREQQHRAAALLDETRRKLYAILAEDTHHDAHAGDDRGHDAERGHDGAHASDTDLAHPAESAPHADDAAHPEA